MSHAVTTLSLTINTIQCWRVYENKTNERFWKKKKKPHESYNITFFETYYYVIRVYLSIRGLITTLPFFRRKCFVWFHKCLHLWPFVRDMIEKNKYWCAFCILKFSRSFFNILRFRSVTLKPLGPTRNRDTMCPEGPEDASEKLIRHDKLTPKAERETRRNFPGPWKIQNYVNFDRTPSA